jgi:hypothetical protein
MKDSDIIYAIKVLSDLLQNPGVLDDKDLIKELKNKLSDLIKKL